MKKKNPFASQAQRAAPEEKKVRFVDEENNIIITTEDPENITSGKETLECNYDGEPIIIGYNATYLKEVLQHQSSNEIKILLRGHQL